MSAAEMGSLSSHLAVMPMRADDYDDRMTTTMMAGRMAR
jgi:hypothetical protein